MKYKKNCAKLVDFAQKKQNADFQIPHSKGARCDEPLIKTMQSLYYICVDIGIYVFIELYNSVLHRTG